ncbi:hypothetical protein PPTG_21653 [Phytophthora nicotianae INRA-310]|uniref:Uncharacterized protein n=1 Tax=Phytophthora nicotianae (strain INRA-310) TaxID=761204 RepID=W2QYW6_PHYN3|nr:hypothetical protein PPTG_21653 [Phytophthora nicotianae INRA-310]ETN17460.1 hypothetical protein PPTG_21653 [Phytophthora nicotianae INRA-310]
MVVVPLLAKSTEVEVPVQELFRLVQAAVRAELYGSAERYRYRRIAEDVVYASRKALKRKVDYCARICLIRAVYAVQIL